MGLKGDKLVIGALNRLHGIALNQAIAQRLRLAKIYLHAPSNDEQVSIIRQIIGWMAVDKNLREEIARLRSLRRALGIEKDTTVNIEAANRRNERRAGCVSVQRRGKRTITKPKLKYTKHEAIIASQLHTKSTGEQWGYYQCKSCNEWHIGHNNTWLYSRKK